MGYRPRQRTGRTSSARAGPTCESPRGGPAPGLHLPPRAQSWLKRGSPCRPAAPLEPWLPRTGPLRPCRPHSPQELHAAPSAVLSVCSLPSHTVLAWRGSHLHTAAVLVLTAAAPLQPSSSAAASPGGSRLSAPYRSAGSYNGSSRDTQDCGSGSASSPSSRRFRPAVPSWQPGSRWTQTIAAWVPCSRTRK